MFLHAPPRLEQAILHRMADPGKAFEVRGVETEKIRLLGRLDNQGVRQLDHLLLPSVLLDSGSLQDSMARPCRDFLGAVIVNPNQLFSSGFAIVSDGSLLLHQGGAVLLQHSDQLTEFHALFSV